MSKALGLFEGVAQPPAGVPTVVFCNKKTHGGKTVPPSEDNILNPRRRIQLS